MCILLETVRRILLGHFQHDAQPKGSSQSWRRRPDMLTSNIRGAVWGKGVQYMQSNGKKFTYTTQKSQKTKYPLESSLLDKQKSLDFTTYRLGGDGNSQFCILDCFWKYSFEV